MDVQRCACLDEAVGQIDRGSEFFGGHLFGIVTVGQQKALPLKVGGNLWGEFSFFFTTEGEDRSDAKGFEGVCGFYCGDRADREAVLDDPVEGNRSRLNGLG